MKLNEFLNTSYTAYHTTANAVKMLEENGFVRFTLGCDAKFTVGGKYFVTMNDSSVIAFVVGSGNAFNVVESHTDSPSFKVKGNCVITANGVTRVNTEKYGGGLLYSYFDRPMKIAGRLLTETPDGVESQLVLSAYNVVIPSLCIHHNPTANDGFQINPQTDTLPLLGLNASDVYSTLTTKRVLDADLFVVPVTEAFRAGVDGELLCSPRIDNLTSVYSSIAAIVDAKSDGIAVAACLDNEEIGSGTRQGSPDFLHDVMDFVAEKLGIATDKYAEMRNNGMVLSVDNGHAVHPAHPEKYDPVAKVYMGKGVVVKHHVNYSTDGLTSALFKRVAELADVPVQDYYNNSAVRCGSTLGLATSREIGMKTCDIGIAQLAMHSACETIAIADVDSMTKVLTAFMSAKLSGNKVSL